MKKNNIEQLYSILNGDSKKYKISENEKHLQSLLIWLKSSESKTITKTVGKLKEEDEELLKPKVIIHSRGKKKIEKIEYKEEKPKEKIYDKDLIEIEKPDEIELEFIQVKPKIFEKTKDEEFPEEELVEWDEDDVKTTKPKETKEEILTDEKLIFRETIDDFDKKIEIFKDFKTINEETAILLYDHGYTTIESLKKATIKDLRKIKGIKRKTAKKIIKEIDNKIKGESKEKTIEKSESIEKQVKEDLIEPQKKETPLRSEEIIYSEWEPVEEKELEEKTSVKTEETPEERNKKIEIFKDFKTINEETAILLYDHGYTTIESLKKATIKDLRKIKGIKRKTAKKIIKEIAKLPEITTEEFIPETVKEKKQIRKKTIDKKKTPEKELKGFVHKGYTLYEKKIKAASGKKVTIRFFSKSQPKMAKPIQLPKGFKILINKKTGVPYIKKKR
jgi:Holliday junction resolvasome RuvABC DNA-binding subunit